MPQPMYAVDALILRKSSSSETSSLLINSNNYSITIPAGNAPPLNIRINNSPINVQDYTSQNVYSRADRLSSGIPLTSVDFASNWVTVGTIALSGTTGVVVNMPTRFLKLQITGATAIPDSFIAYIWNNSILYGM